VSRRKLGDDLGLDRRAIEHYEGGDERIPEAVVEQLTALWGIHATDLVPAGYYLSLVLPPTAGEGPALRGTALDALLREYLAMVVEMRGTECEEGMHLRQEDLRELAAVLGDSPDAIEARLVELIGATTEQARRLRLVLVPSSADASFGRQGMVG
jgi:hypothetical protein